MLHSFAHVAVLIVIRMFHTVAHWILSGTTYRIIFNSSEGRKKRLSKAQNTAELVVHPVLTEALGLIESRLEAAKENRSNFLLPKTVQVYLYAMDDTTFALNS